MTRIVKQSLGRNSYTIGNAGNLPVVAFVRTAIQGVDYTNLPNEYDRIHGIIQGGFQREADEFNNGDVMGTYAAGPYSTWATYDHSRGAS